MSSTSQRASLAPRTSAWPYPLSCPPAAAPAERLSWSSSDGTPLVAHAWIPPDPWGSLLMLHGIGMHSAPYASIAGAFHDAGIALYVPDVRGHGESGTPGCLPTLRQLTRDLDDLAQQIHRRLDRPIFLGGESMGGLLVNEYARQRQEEYRGLILMVPGYQVAESRLRARPDFRTLLRTGRVLIDTTENLEASSRMRGFVQAKQNDPQVQHAVTLRFLAQLGWWGVRSAWSASQLQMPVTMHLAEFDEAICNVSAQQVFQRFASGDKSLRVWSQALHTLCWDPVTPDLIEESVRWMRARA